MKLVASLVTHNEAGRYLGACIDHLFDFCDAVYALDDGSTDGTAQRMQERGVNVNFQDRSTFFLHEGQTRQHAIGWALTSGATHVINIDVDEFVSDGAAVRRACESGADVHSLEMREVWKASDECLCVRGDGGWRPHHANALWKVPADTSRLRIADRALACGRVPEVVDQTRAIPTGASIFHFGWSNEAERVARHERYAVADGGRFHASAHLASILWPDEQVAMAGFDWPADLLPYRDRILEHASKEATTP